MQHEMLFSAVAIASDCSQASVKVSNLPAQLNTTVVNGTVGSARVSAASDRPRHWVDREQASKPTNFPSVLAAGSFKGQALQGLLWSEVLCNGR